jgi:aminoglycoside phosphotransferase
LGHFVGQRQPVTTPFSEYDPECDYVDLRLDPRRSSSILTTVPRAQPLGSKDVAAIARRALRLQHIRAERVGEGGSTYVYRLTTERDTFFLRMQPEIGKGFAAEAEVHRRLRQAGVRVPDVICFGEDTERSGRSFMITTEVPGSPISASSSMPTSELERIVANAGQDLLAINRVSVAGYGWVQDTLSPTGVLRAEVSTYGHFALQFWQTDLRFLAETTLTAQEVNALERLVDRFTCWLKLEEAHLAHGDFDSTHIYQVGGRYSGIIDFGEIRGADVWYDLGHFHLRDGERVAIRLDRQLIAAWLGTTTIPIDVFERIRFSSTLTNVRTLTNSLQKRPPNFATHHQVLRLREDLKALS